MSQRAARRAMQVERGAFADSSRGSESAPNLAARARSPPRFGTLPGAFGVASPAKDRYDDLFSQAPVVFAVFVMHESPGRQSALVVQVPHFGTHCQPVCYRTGCSIAPVALVRDLGGIRHPPAEEDRASLPIPDEEVERLVDDKEVIRGRRRVARGGRRGRRRSRLSDSEQSPMPLRPAAGTPSFSRP